MITASRRAVHAEAAGTEGVLSGRTVPWPRMGASLTAAGELHMDVGFIGLGQMGAAMAASLLRGGPG